ncbi:hypothetical protein BC829DRAFT_407719 [Chytridium lagenaria]|nr:hypothetical protein BC829DRAFT_407719 [Chytridium lagenaria]
MSENGDAPTDRDDLQQDNAARSYSQLEDGGYEHERNEYGASLEEKMKTNGEMLEQDENFEFESTPARDIDERSDIADDGQEQERRVSFIVPMPPIESEGKAPSILPEFKNIPPSPKTKTSAKEPEEPPKVEVRKWKEKSELPIAKTNLTVAKQGLDAHDSHHAHHHGGSGKDTDPFHRHQPYLHTAGMHGHALHQQPLRRPMETPIEQQHHPDHISRSATPIQLSLPSGFARAPSRQSRPSSGAVIRGNTFAATVEGKFEPISFEIDTAEDATEPPSPSRSRAGILRQPNSRPLSRTNRTVDGEDEPPKKHALRSLQPNEIPFNPFPARSDSPQPSQARVKIASTPDALEVNAPSKNLHVQYQDDFTAGKETRYASRASSRNAPRPPSEASTRSPGTAHAYCSTPGSRPPTPSSPNAAAASVPKTQSVRTNIDKYRIEQIALRRLRFVIENSQAEPEHLSIMKLVEAGDVPRSLFIRFFGPKHQTAHDVRVLLLQSIERTARARKRQSRRQTRARTTSPWNRDYPTEDPFPSRSQTAKPQTANAESLLDPRVIAKHAREVMVRDVKSRRGVRTPGDLLTILDQVDREAQSAREGRSRVGHGEALWGGSRATSRLRTATTPFNRKSFGLPREAPPPPDLLAEFERLLEMEEKKMKLENRRKSQKLMLEEKRRLGEEVDEELLGTEEATRAYLKDLELDKVTGDPEIRRKASLILSEAHMLRVIQRRKMKHLQL